MEQLIDNEGLSKNGETKECLIMNVIKTSIDGVVMIEPRIFEDARGYFFESFSQREFDEKVDAIHRSYQKKVKVDNKL